LQVYAAEGPSWLIVDGWYGDNSSLLHQFREISLLNVEGKIFWSMVAQRITSFLLKNKYIDTCVQKVGVAGFAGCIEHTAAITQKDKFQVLSTNSRIGIRQLTKHHCLAA
jgi:hypothetical protein